MNGVTGFIGSMMVRRAFWLLFFANFTIAMMLVMRNHNRDQIFKLAAAKFDRKGFFD